MTHSALNRAYLILLGLSVLTVLLTEIRPQAGMGFVAMVLALSGLKARIILLDYLGLRGAGSWQRGFNAFLILFLLVAFGLYLAA
ncbi:cytochrome C oxidase subunit IV family protein [Aliiroseovarius crassostreae]|uniref:Cytochrome C oxidase subunit IV family protein n=1 Tax=Aliiroseovarius crassostreae TaxID=154981 RepID=A0A9Q9H9N7_9RHOB|nr:cytochrome C oxidase subunit IV family protein [Aliiroseovarius crassostreae]UWP88981.1 cytochrome C oxidase subunit IV family protein [Aliiroseovarius crassostreae]UWP92139.1 cytochrome C oxidase subunit IV family protein [Aliiroseovarius crassostreae]UWP95286.1 cytochrome C oxidase subunit IV family protein [Aliiroseovarius crassostreae]UWP98446.1 cytochrome C oxidase subunit IV family protein [Aliiroseovarius crassostreae]UWQ01630.1 cytochrome C oxidase subunit IV family protein [Aliiros